MRTTLLDFSQRHELSLHSEVAADVMDAVNASGIEGLVVGACARDLHLHYGAGVPVQRGTEDIDFAFLVSDWAEFDALYGRLLGVRSGPFEPIEGKQHRVRHRNGISVDLVPFGAIETRERRIAWPPTGKVVMDVFGFREALASADMVILPRRVKIQIVSLPALALLKLIAWNERHERSPGKDAADLVLIIRSYLAVADNQQRLWDDFSEWTESSNFDYEHSGARMLGHDIRRLVDEKGLGKVGEILRAQLDEETIGILPGEMDRRFPEQARALLQSLCDGLLK